MVASTVRVNMVTYGDLINVLIQCRVFQFWSNLRSLYWADSTKVASIMALWIHVYLSFSYNNAWSLRNVYWRKFCAAEFVSTQDHATIIVQCYSCDACTKYTVYIYRLTLSSGWFCNWVLKLQIMTAVYLQSGLMCNGVKLGDTSEQAGVFPAGKCHRKSLTFREGLCARQPFRCPWKLVKFPVG